LGKELKISQKSSREGGGEFGDNACGEERDLVFERGFRRDEAAGEKNHGLTQVEEAKGLPHVKKRVTIPGQAMERVGKRRGKFIRRRINGSCRRACLGQRTGHWGQWG